jgi:hypothetical protein
VNQIGSAGEYVGAGWGEQNPRERLVSERSAQGGGQRDRVGAMVLQQRSGGNCDLGASGDRRERINRGGSGDPRKAVISDHDGAAGGDYLTRVVGTPRPARTIRRNRFQRGEASESRCECTTLADFAPCGCRRFQLFFAATEIRSSTGKIDGQCGEFNRPDHPD